MNHFVLDASVALAWILDPSPDPYSFRVGELLAAGDRAVVPALWRLEVANGLVVAEKRGIVKPAETKSMLEGIEILLGHAIESLHEPVSLRRVTATAREFQLTAYDASYLELARERHIPLATLDHALARAAKRAGVALVR